MTYPHCHHSSVFLRWPQWIDEPGGLAAGNPWRRPDFEPGYPRAARERLAAGIDRVRLEWAAQCPRFLDRLAVEDEVSREDLEQGAAGLVAVEAPAPVAPDLDDASPVDREDASAGAGERLALELLRLHAKRYANPWRRAEWHPEVTGERRQRLLAAYDRVLAVGRGGPEGDAVLDEYVQGGGVMAVKQAARGKSEKPADTGRIPCPNGCGGTMLLWAKGHHLRYCKGKLKTHCGPETHSGVETRSATQEELLAEAEALREAKKEAALQIDSGAHGPAAVKQDESGGFVGDSVQPPGAVPAVGGATIEFRANGKLAKLIDRLLSTGLYGTNRGMLAEQLVCAGIREAIVKGVIERC